MRKLLLLSMLILFSCRVNETCKEKTFKDYNWNVDNSTQIDNLRFGDDDTVTFDLPALSITNYRKAYSFNEDCESFNWSITGNQHWVIIKNENNIIWIKEDGGSEYHLSR